MKLDTKRHLHFTGCRVIYEKVDWSKVQPSNGDAHSEKRVAAKFSAE